MDAWTFMWQLSIFVSVCHVVSNQICPRRSLSAFHLQPLMYFGHYILSVLITFATHLTRSIDITRYVKLNHVKGKLLAVKTKAFPCVANRIVSNIFTFTWCWISKLGHISPYGFRPHYHTKYCILCWLIKSTFGWLIPLLIQQFS